MGGWFAQPSTALVEAVAPSLVTLIIRPLLRSRMQKDTWLYEVLWTTELENNVRALVKSPLKTSLHHLKDAQQALKTGKDASAKKSLDWAYQYAVESLTVHEQLDNYWDRFHLQTNILIHYIFVKAFRARILGDHSNYKALQEELRKTHADNKKRFQIFMEEPDMDEQILDYRQQEAALTTKLERLQSAKNTSSWADRIDTSSDILGTERELTRLQRLRPGRYIRSWIHLMKPRDDDVYDLYRFLHGSPTA